MEIIKVEIYYIEKPRKTCDALLETENLAWSTKIQVTNAHGLFLKCVARLGYPKSSYFS